LTVDYVKKKNDTTVFGRYTPKPGFKPFLHNAVWYQ